jgi:hypothetical protein
LSKKGYIWLDLEFQASFIHGTILFGKLIDKLLYYPIGIITSICILIYIYYAITKLTLTVLKIMSLVRYLGDLCGELLEVFNAVCAPATVILSLLGRISYYTIHQISVYILVFHFKRVEVYLFWICVILYFL